MQRFTGFTCELGCVDHRWLDALSLTFYIGPVAFRCQEWAKSFIEFEVQAANAFWRNTTIGLVALQLSLVQKRKTHQVKKSLPLQSPDGADLHVCSKPVRNPWRGERGSWLGGSARCMTPADPLQPAFGKVKCLSVSPAGMLSASCM